MKTKMRKKVAPVESTKDFRLRMSKAMRGAAGAETPAEIDARFSPNRASAWVLRNPRKRRNGTGKTITAARTMKLVGDPSHVHIDGIKTRHPVWRFEPTDKRGVLMSVTPQEHWRSDGRKQFRITVTDEDGDTAVIWMPFKAFRALNHWGMAIAKKGKK
jgi:hypothetical protein